MFSQLFSKLTFGSAREFGQYFRNNWPPKKSKYICSTRISNLLPEITILTKWDKCKVTIEKSKSSYWIKNLLKLYHIFNHLQFQEIYSIATFFLISLLLFSVFFVKTINCWKIKKLRFPLIIEKMNASSKIMPTKLRCRLYHCRINHSPINQNPKQSLDYRFKSWIS